MKFLVLTVKPLFWQLATTCLCRLCALSWRNTNQQSLESSHRSIANVAFQGAGLMIPGAGIWNVESNRGSESSSERRKEKKRQDLVLTAQFCLIQQLWGGTSRPTSALSCPATALIAARDIRHSEDRCSVCCLHFIFPHKAFVFSKPINSFLWICYLPMLCLLLSLLSPDFHSIPGPVLFYPLSIFLNNQKLMLFSYAEFF